MWSCGKGRILWNLAAEFISFPALSLFLFLKKTEYWLSWIILRLWIAKEYVVNSKGRMLLTQTSQFKSSPDFLRLFVSLF